MLNAAQVLLQSFFTPGVEPRGYKAPHANRPTPARPRFTRKSRFAVAYDDEGNVTAVRKPRLFKGHRP